MNCYFIAMEMNKMKDPIVINNNVSANQEEIMPLKISYEQYEGCMLVLAREAIENNDPKTCQKYFEFKKRATFGDGYPEIEGMENIEKRLLEIVNEEKVFNNRKPRR